MDKLHFLLNRDEFDSLMNLLNKSRDPDAKYLAHNLYQQSAYNPADQNE